MKIIRTALLFVSAVVFSAICVSRAKADNWNEKTLVTFNDSVEIPGQTLPAGSYVFQLANSSANRAIVEIWNADQTQLIATLITIPDYRAETPNKTIFDFDERPGDSPMAIDTWYFPGKNFGLRFIY
ncbi:MAG: hypothetical protein WA621_13390 [Candidatus Acidiferrum sp.]